MWPLKSSWFPAGIRFSVRKASLLSSKSRFQSTATRAAVSSRSSLVHSLPWNRPGRSNSTVLVSTAGFATTRRELPRPPRKSVASKNRPPLWLRKRQRDDLSPHQRKLQHMQKAMDAYSVEQLKNMCRLRGLSQGGQKVDLVERLYSDAASNDLAYDSDVDSDDDHSDSDDDGNDSDSDDESNLETNDSEMEKGNDVQSSSEGVDDDFGPDNDASREGRRPLAGNQLGVNVRSRNLRIKWAAAQREEQLARQYMALDNILNDDLTITSVMKKEVKVRQQRQREMPSAQPFDASSAARLRHERPHKQQPSTKTMNLAVDDSFAMEDRASAQSIRPLESTETLDHRTASTMLPSTDNDSSPQPQQPLLFNGRPVKRLFFCPNCHQQFRYGKCLTMHVSRKPACRLAMSCPDCFQHFTTREGLQRHVDNKQTACRAHNQPPRSLSSLFRHRP